MSHRAGPSTRGRAGSSAAAAATRSEPGNPAPREAGIRYGEEDEPLGPSPSSTCSGSRWRGVTADVGGASDTGGSAIELPLDRCQRPRGSCPLLTGPRSRQTVRRPPALCRGKCLASVRKGRASLRCSMAPSTDRTAQTRRRAAQEAPAATRSGAAPVSASSAQQEPSAGRCSAPRQVKRAATAGRLTRQRCGRTRRTAGRYDVGREDPAPPDAEAKGCPPAKITRSALSGRLDKPARVR
jgi:hypothetical protein